MKTFLVLLVATVTGLAGARAAISIGPVGSGLITFSNQPTVSDGWSTIVQAGASADITNAAGLDAAVQTNVAAAITTPVGASGVVAPSIGSATAPRWNSVNSNLQSVATTAGYLSLMATLQNDT